MCNCIETLENTIAEKSDFAGKEVVDVELKGVGTFYKLGIPHGEGVRKTKTDVKITFKKGKPLNTYLKHKFCPFCGEHYYKETKEVIE